MSTPAIDATFVYEGTVTVVEAETSRAAEWLAGQLATERRYSPCSWWVEDAEVLSLRDQMQAEGFSVEFCQHGPTY